MSKWLAKWLPLLIAGAIALVGAMLSFAFDDGEFQEHAFGIILLAAALLIALAWLADRWQARRPRTSRSNRTSSTSGADSVKAVGGLIAAVIAILSIVALSLVIVLKVSGFQADKAIAFAASAFGVISAITGAYLGIKITSEQAAGTQQAAGLAQAQAAVSQAPEGAAKQQAQTDLAQAAVQAQTGGG